MYSIDFKEQIYFVSEIVLNGQSGTIRGKLPLDTKTECSLKPAAARNKLPKFPGSRILSMIRMAGSGFQMHLMLFVFNAFDGPGGETRAKMNKAVCYK